MSVRDTIMQAMRGELDVLSVTYEELSIRAANASSVAEYSRDQKVADTQLVFDEAEVKLE